MDALADIAEAAGALRMRARPGDVVFRPDEICKGFIAVRLGAIRVQLVAPTGREIVLYRVRPGQVCLQTFRCLVQGGAYAAEGVAEQDVEAFRIAPGMFDRLMSEDPRFRAAVLGSIAQRFADFENVVEALAFTGLQARLAGALLRLVDGDGLVEATHEVLASEIGSAREAVSRQLGLFAREGLVHLGRGRIALRDRDALTRLSPPPV